MNKINDVGKKKIFCLWLIKLYFTSKDEKIELVLRLLYIYRQFVDQKERCATQTVSGIGTSDFTVNGHYCFNKL